jgi:hypothetical protein
MNGTSANAAVMPGLVPGIHVFLPTKDKTWMAGHRRAEATPFFERLRPAMTKRIPKGIYQ